MPRAYLTRSALPCCAAGFHLGPSKYAQRFSSPIRFFARFEFIWGMQPIQRIVDVYVRYGNRKALDDLRVHRGGLIRELWAVMSGPYDISSAIAELENDIAVIEAGITNLNSSAIAAAGR